jgi:hypothetical protein
MFKNIFKVLKNGGLYCIESLHYQPLGDMGMKTVDLLMNWKQGTVCGNEYIKDEEARELYSMIESIEFYPSKSPKWDPNIIKNALCVITKAM